MKHHETADLPMCLLACLHVTESFPSVPVYGPSKYAIMYAIHTRAYTCVLPHIWDLDIRCGIRDGLQMPIIVACSGLHSDMLNVCVERLWQTLGLETHVLLRSFGEALEVATSVFPTMMCLRRGS